jgi:hypothetical protein
LSLGLGYSIGQIPIMFYPFFLIAHLLYVSKTKIKFWDRKFIEANAWLFGLVAIFTFLNFYTVYKHFYDVLLALSKILGLEEEILAVAPRIPSATMYDFSIFKNWIFIAKTIFYNFPVVFLAAISGSVILFKKFKLDARNIFLIILPWYAIFIFSFIFYHFLCRYTLPIIPFLIIVASYFVFWLWNNALWKKSKIILVAFIVMISFYSLAASGLYSLKLLKSYTLSLAVEWIYKNVPTGSRMMSDLYLNSNKESLEFLEEHNMYSWLDVRKKYLLQMPEEKYPQPNYFLIDTNLTNVSSLPIEDKKMDYAEVSFYSKQQENEAINNLNVFGKREIVFSLYPKGEKKDTQSLLNLQPHFFLKNIWETNYIGPNVEIYKIIK